MNTFNKAAWFQLKSQLLEYLCPPGNGVYTYQAGQEKRTALQQMLFGNNDVVQTWQKTLDQLPESQYPLILGVCSDAGGGIQRGANWGPLYIRESLYRQLNHPSFFDIGDVRVIPQLLSDELLNNKTIHKCRKALYGKLNTPLAVSPLSITADVVNGIRQLFPHKSILGLGGDHSVSYPSVKSYLVTKKRLGRKAALIHFDAHTDLLSERLGIDICFGSWASHILNYLPAPSHLVQIGIRSSQHDQHYWENLHGIKQFWASSILNSGIEAISDNICKYIKSLDIDEVYVSFDIDVLDIKYAAATGTPETNGLSLEQAIYLLHAISQCTMITNGDIMEVAPFIGTQYSNSLSSEPETTLNSACQIATFLLQEFISSNKNLGEPCLQ